MNKWVFDFESNFDNQNKNLKALLGGKGATLVQMNSIDIPVPPGFIISTDYCREYYENKESDGKERSFYLSDELKKEVREGIKRLEKKLNKKFGIAENNKMPLLVSVRSGAPISMPGMMDSILNLGLNDELVHHIAKVTKNKRFAYDTYRRFLQMYGSIVLAIDQEDFYHSLEVHKKVENLEENLKITDQLMKDMALDYQEIIAKNSVSVPQDSYEQLFAAICSVLNSWMNPRAVKYREMCNIPSDLGTAVTIQSMVYGNLSDRCATGVLFTRNPSNGERGIFGEFLTQAQGEDVVDGSSKTLPITNGNQSRYNSDQSMELSMPETFQELKEICDKLEKHCGDMQDIEFTVEENKLWILQTRSGKRTTDAALKIANDMVQEKIISKKQALQNIEAKSLDKLLHTTIDTRRFSYQPIGIGLPASPGVATGSIVLSSQDVNNNPNNPSILVRLETNPDDIMGMEGAQGIITARGGMTSHAAVVARSIGKPCVCSVEKMQINREEKILIIGDVIIREGDIITIDGSTGHIILGSVPLAKPSLSGNFQTIMSWSDQCAKMNVRANAETINDTINALKLGAKGIGLCRTEHMFFSKERIFAMRKMIFAKKKETRIEVLRELEAHQEQDFTNLFQVLGDLPIAIRLLDPPLHEFLPKDFEVDDFANKMNCDRQLITDLLSDLHESNPMLGHRGCRLAITYPEIYHMQARAIFHGVISARNKFGLKNIVPEIMIPFVIDQQEILIIKKIIENAKKEILNAFTLVDDIDYKVGAMIESPRAVILADKISAVVDFISFGTNDLTQTTMAISRDDNAKFMSQYINKRILKVDPFVCLDFEGVSELLKIAVIKAKQGNKKIKIGVCGEHGGEPNSISFFASLGIDYVSCSPYRVPIARLASAQASDDS